MMTDHFVRHVCIVHRAFETDKAQFTTTACANAIGRSARMSTDPFGTRLQKGADGP
jgi:hypothetical protein